MHVQIILLAPVEMINVHVMRIMKAMAPTVTPVPQIPM
jgi:hypothetical protein